MSLNLILNQETSQMDLVQLNHLLHMQHSKVKASVTFWGKRAVSIEGGIAPFEQVSLEALAKKVLQNSRNRSEADNLTPKERVAGIEIAKKLNEFYAITDEKIKNSNFFTKILNWIREFVFFYPYTTRFFVEDGLQANFQGYSPEKFVQVFGGTKETIEQNSAFSGGSFGGGGITRFCAKEEAIRALASS